MLKRILQVPAALVVVMVVALVAVYALSERRLARLWEVSPAPVAVPMGAAERAEGLRLYFTRGCAECHGDDLGGKVVIDDPMMGTFVGSNLTSGPGGVGARSDLDLVRAIRHGVGADGRGLALMPSHEFNVFADAEVGAMIGAIRDAAPVDRTTPPPSPGPLMRVLFLAGEVPMLVAAELIDHDAPRPPAPAVGPNAAYGGYLANLCMGCHGQGLSGGAIPGTPPDWPPSTNITSDPTTGIGAWSEQDFVRAMREGTRPDGTAMSPVMPWRNFSQMTDVELAALWAFLRTVPARPAGGR